MCTYAKAAQLTPLLVLALTFCVCCEASTPYIVTSDTLAATSKEDYNRALRMTMDGDSRALMNYILAGAGVRILKRGTKVYLTGMGGFFSGLVKVRMPGGYEEYYVATEHVREYDPSQLSAPARSYARPQNATTPDTSTSKPETPQEAIERLLQEADGMKRLVATYEKGGKRKYAVHYTKLLHEIRLQLAQAYLDTGGREACTQQLNLIPKDSPVSDEVAKIRRVLSADPSDIDTAGDDRETEPNKAASPDRKTAPLVPRSAVPGR